MSVRLRVERDGWLRSSALAALFVAIFFTASLHFITEMGEQRSAPRCWLIKEGADAASSGGDTSRNAVSELPSDQLRCEQPEQLNTDPAAFTVALLGVISLGVTRVGEHGYTARLLRRLRILALVAAVVPIAAAWLLVYPGPGRILSIGWTILVVVSWLLASVLVAVWRAPQR